MANERLWTKERITYFWNKIKSLVSTTASGKVDKVSGKGLSTNDYTDNDKTALQTTIPGRISAIEQAKGANGGYAELDNAGKVPSSQLPSFVDDVLEYASLGNFPLTGESGKIYIALDTNKTYRWSGSAYVEISSSLALGETSSTAYRGDRGKAAYDHAAAKGSAFDSGLYKIATNDQGHVTGATAVAKSDITGLGIPAQDTTYSNKSAVSEGTDVSLVTTGEKYTWNHKVGEDQGSSNAGKVLGINAQGIVEPTEMKAGGSTYYAVCDTAANTQVKAVTISDITELKAGLSVRIKFTNAHSYNGQPKLQINSLTAIGIVRNGTTAAAIYEWNAGEVLDFVYDGTNFAIVAGAIPTTTYYGSRIKLSSSTSSTSEALAATPKGVKAAYDLANSKAANTAFTGATSSADGVKGLVPAPLAGEHKLYLKGDGTWAEPDGVRLYVADLDSVTNTSGSYTHTSTVTGMTSDLKAVLIECSNPEIFRDKVTVTTGSGTVTLTCADVAGTSTVRVSFAVQGNANPLNSTEYAALDARIGDLSDLETADKSSVVGAVNALNSSITWKSWHDENYNAGSYSTEVGLPTNWNELYVIVNMTSNGYAQTFPIIVVKSIAKDNDIYRIGFYASSNDYARVHFKYYSNKIKVTDAQINGSNYAYELRIGYR